MPTEVGRGGGILAGIFELGGGKREIRVGFDAGMYLVSAPVIKNHLVKEQAQDQKRKDFIFCFLSLRRSGKRLVSCSFDKKKRCCPEKKERKRGFARLVMISGIHPPVTRRGSKSENQFVWGGLGVPDENLLECVFRVQRDPDQGKRDSGNWTIAGCYGEIAPTDKECHC